MTSLPPPAAAAGDAVVATFPVPPVVKTVDVPLSRAEAFERFTGEIHRWWPAATHSLAEAEVVLVAFEPQVGGRLFERRSDGQESPWGTVVAWTPPSHVAFSWHVGRAPETAQRVDVTFTPVDGGTRVRLEHSGWEALGERARSARDEYDSGWNFVFLTRYAQHAGVAA